MCLFGQPSTPKIGRVATPPPIKQVKIAETGKGPARTQLQEEKKPVAFGAKSLKKASTRSKTDSASLMVPLNKPTDNSGGINV